MRSQGPLDISQLRSVLSAGQFEWRKHVLQRLAERGIAQSDVLEVIGSGERIADYPDDSPFPSALFMGWIEERPIHVVIALDSTNKWVYIITAYEPDLNHYEADFRTRRSN